MGARESKSWDDASVDALLADVTKRLERGQPARRRLPGGGFLAIDRRLPFLLVHRRPAVGDDRSTERLIRSEASFLVVSSDPEMQTGVRRLIRGLVDFLVAEFSGLLVVEIWAAEIRSTDAIDFSLVIARPEPPGTVTEMLLRSLGDLRLLDRPSRVQRETVDDVRPTGLPALFSRRERVEMSCAWIGLEVESVYRDSNGRAYPLTVRGMRRKLSRCLNRTVHQFALAATTHTPPSYLALGRSKFLKRVFEVDRRITAISESFDFLVAVTPIDVESRWQEFEASGFEPESIDHNEAEAERARKALETFEKVDLSSIISTGLKNANALVDAEKENYRRLNGSPVQD